MLKFALLVYFKWCLMVCMLDLLHSNLLIY